MAITPAFSVSQSNITPASVTVTDTSTGTYGTITQRRIYLSDANGNFLTGNGIVSYTIWPLANISITLPILYQDTAANIKVEWLDVNNGVVNVINNNFPLSEFGKQFLYYLVQLQALQPGSYQDVNYRDNLANQWTDILGGDNAVTYGNDIAAAQNAYNKEIYRMQNQSLFFK